MTFKVVLVLDDWNCFIELYCETASAKTPRRRPMLAVVNESTRNKRCGGCNAVGLQT